MVAANQNGRSSRTTLAQAKRVALEAFTAEFIFPAFASHLKKRCKVSGEEMLFFDFEGARRRLDDAVLLSNLESERRKDEIYGETDGETIWILRGLSLEECVVTLLHEAMHDVVFLRRCTRSGDYKGLSCDLEHEIIYGLLEPVCDDEGV